MDFVHLHVHTEYSLLDGASRISDLLDHAKELGQKAIAITDHGNMFGVIDFYKYAKKIGLKPILGFEAYIITGDIRERESNQREYAHIILLAKDHEGYQNLMKLTSIGYVEGFYYRPRIDYKTLREHAKGLICTSACLAGDIPQLLLSGQKKAAYELAKQLKEIFGEDFYIELQDHGLLEQKQVLPLLIELAKDLDIKTILTNDVHYVRREDAKAQDVLMCIQMNKYVAEDGSLGFGTDQFYLKSAEEMAEILPYLPEAMENTLEIAEKCNVEIEFGKLHLPKFDVPAEYTHEEFLEHLTREGMAQKYPDPSIHEERLQYELKTIYSMGFTDYFLIVQDYVNFAKSQEIPVGPGRGSAAGSLVAYALGITNIDPIRYNLLFERFLNPERVSMPDIDMDFCYERRQEVIDYVTRKYGEDRVAQIVTFGTLGARQVVRDVARVMRISVAESDRIAKMVPRELKITLPKALEQNAKLRAEYDTNPEVHEWLDMAMKLEGMPRHTSTHAAGVIISENPVTEYVPLSKNQKDEAITTQYSMGELEPLGLLKMDFLGLRTLTVIRDAVDLIEQQHGIKLDIDTIDYDDSKVYEMIGTGSTDGVFQLESEGMRSLMTQLRPENLGDVMVGISLFRPGPMAKIPDYIAGKNDREKVTYAHPILEKDLKDTYGCMVYQEQVMELVRDMAGYSLARSDLVRRAMAKKKQDVMEHERQIFVYGGEGVDGAIKRGVPEKVAHDVFDQMMDFAQYAFNKSHACAYAVVAYQTAYLKHYYETEFMTALLNSFITNSDKLAHYMRYIVSAHIPLLPPDINRSEKRFSVENGGIRFGLYALKNVGDAISGVIGERGENGAYSDLQDFIHRNAGILNKTQIESLILSGCFDSLGGNRAQLMAAYDNILKNEQERTKQLATGQMSFFDLTDEGKQFDRFVLPNIPEFEHKQLLAFEKEKIGLYISGHPLAEYEAYLRQQKETIGHILEAEHDLRLASSLDGKQVSLLGIVSSMRVRTTKQSRQQMLNAVFEDMTGSIGLIVFPKAFQSIGDVFAVDRVVRVTGRVMINDEAPPEINVERAEVFTPGDPQYIGKQLYIRMKTEDLAAVRKLKEILRLFPGEQTTRVFIEETRKQYSLGNAEAVRYQPELIQKLEAEFGKENIVLK